MHLFASLIIFFLVSTHLTAKHVAPHFDIRPLLTEKEIQNHAEETNDESLLLDESKRDLIRKHKKSLQKPQKKFRKFLARTLVEPSQGVELPQHPNKLYDYYEQTESFNIGDIKKQSKLDPKNSDALDDEPSEQGQKTTGATLRITDDKLRLKRKVPAVTEIGKDTVAIDPDFETLAPTLVIMNKLAYAIGKRGTLDGAYDQRINQIKSNLSAQGWAIEEFQGRTGKDNRKADTPGFVAYNKQTGQMTVILRGSQTREDDDGSPDWEVNFDAAHVPFPYGGTVHRGFYNRTLSMMPGIERAIAKLIRTMSLEERQNLKITVSGHSQGGGLASIVMPLLAESIRTNRWLGQSFDNARDNVIRGYILSSPRVFSGDDALAYFNDTVGKHNVIRQQVVGTLISDPVPFVTPGRTLTSLISLIPFVGESLADRYGGDTGNKSLGYLAADWTSDAMYRNVQTNIRGIFIKQAESFLNNSLSNVKFLLDNPMNFFKLTTMKDLFLSSYQEQVDTLKLMIASVHYGSQDDIEDSLLFGEDLVSTSKPLGTLLAQGFQEKNNQRRGLIGIIKTAVENAAETKRSVPSLAAAAAGIKGAVVQTAKTFKGAFSGFTRKIFGV